jgi:hypothetical protein
VLQNGKVTNRLFSNYGPTILPASKAKAKGFTQILWLYDGKVGEVGTSNIFFVLKGKDGVKELVTPELDGLILPGVTRDSIIVPDSHYQAICIREPEGIPHRLTQHSCRRDYRSSTQQNCTVSCYLVVRGFRCWNSCHCQPSQQHWNRFGEVFSAHRPEGEGWEAGFEGVRWSVEHPRGKDTSPMVKEDQLILRATDDGCKFIL